MEWKTITEAPSFEVNKNGDVRNKSTNHILTPQYCFWGIARVVLKDSQVKINKQFKIDNLITKYFGSDGVLMERKPRVVEKKQKLQRNCGDCQWNFGGKCSVKNLGMVSVIEDDDKCGKWERIREDNYSASSVDENYENVYTALYEGVNLDSEWNQISF